MFFCLNNDCAVIACNVVRIFVCIIFVNLFGVWSSDFNLINICFLFLVCFAVSFCFIAVSFCFHAIVIF